MKKTISVLQQKGGVGKTTLSVHLAYELAALFPTKCIAVADANPPQNSAFDWISKHHTLYGTSTIRVAVVAEDGTGSDLREELEAIDADLVIIDLPPALELVTLRAAVRSELLLVPIAPSIIDLRATQAALKICREARELDENKKFLLVPNKVRAGTVDSRDFRTLLEEQGPVSETSLGLRVDFANAAKEGKGIVDYKPNSQAHKEIRALAKEVCELIGWEIEA